jgi:arylsulfatase A-like enzyme
MRKLAAALVILALAGNAEAKVSKPHKPTPPRNIIIFVADGLRYASVTAETAPTLVQIQHDGVDFTNSHSLYPTVTTANASVIATGHGIGDTGEWSNSLYTGAPFASSHGYLVAGMENDAVLNEVNARYGGDYLTETSLLKLARDHGYATAAIGKEGPILIQDITAADGKSTIVIDDSTGGKADRAVPLDPTIAAAITAAGLSLNPDDHKANGSMYSDSKAGLKVPNSLQQAWFTDVATKVVLPTFVKSGKPFALVYWSRDPDGTQHNTGDSINAFTPGINGPTAFAGIRDASDNLQRLIDTLKALGVYDNTDIFVTADHGFSTVSRTSKTSWSTGFTYPDNMFPGELPEGFSAIDMAHALGLKLNGNTQPLDPAKGEHPKGTAYLGDDPAHPDAIFVGQGGSELIYLDPAKAKDLAPKLIAALSGEDYVAALFVTDDLGSIPGTLPLSSVGLKGGAQTPQPAIYVGFRDFTTPECLAKWKSDELCSVMVADTSLQQGQGNHGGFTRANTRNFMAAIGPDFKKGFKDATPVSNADITPTLAHAVGLPLASKGKLQGRAMTEALRGGKAVAATPHVLRSAPAANGFTTVLETQSVGDETYLDAAGMPGRVVGLKTAK